MKSFDWVYVSRVGVSEGCRSTRDPPLQCVILYGVRALPRCHGPNLLQVVERRQGNMKLMIVHDLHSLIKHLVLSRQWYVIVTVEVVSYLQSTERDENDT